MCSGRHAGACRCNFSLCAFVGDLVPGAFEDGDLFFQAGVLEPLVPLLVLASQGPEASLSAVLRRLRPSLWLRMVGRGSGRFLESRAGTGTGSLAEDVASGVYL